MNKLRFYQPSADDTGAVTQLCAVSPALTDVYTYIRLHPAPGDDARLWLGADADNKIRAVLYDDGSYITQTDIEKKRFTVSRSAVNGGLFSRPKRKNVLSFMIFCGGRSEPEKAVSILSGTQLLGVMRLISGCEKLPDYVEKKYVEAVRAVNSQLGVYAGIYDGDMLVSCGGITAVNEKYALIGNIFTKEEYRKRGLARAVVLALINEAADRGLIPVLYCEKNKEGFYRKLGFEPFSGDTAVG